jgi:hypothetical protein
VPGTEVLSGLVSERRGTSGPQYGSWITNMSAVEVSRRAVKVTRLWFTLTEMIMSCLVMKDREDRGADLWCGDDYTGHGLGLARLA